MLQLQRELLKDLHHRNKHLLLCNGHNQDAL